MRKNDVRKWIHAALDLLPLFVIPVFMIYSHRHNVEEDTVIVENQPIYYQSNEVNNAYDILEGNIYQFRVDDGNNTLVSIYQVEKILSINYVTKTFRNDSSYLTPPYIYPYLNELIVNAYENNVSANYNYNLDASVIFVAGSITIPPELISYVSYTSAQFVKDYQEVTVTYPNDVGSSLINNLYVTVDKYFNFNHVFNFNQIYDWLSVNIFSGQVPVSAFIAWNIFLYEFLMDLIFLMYALFMFFIDMCTNLIERFTCQASGRRLK